MPKTPLALWVFGPIASGKSWVLSQLPLRDFRRIDQDAALEHQLNARGWHGKIDDYDPAQRTEFERLRAETALELWRQVPDWRLAGENLAFETTGNKPHLFRAETEESRRHGYAALGCGLRCSLAQCLAQNARRARVLPVEIVEETWQAFEQALRDGVYREMFALDQFWICDTPQDAVKYVDAWLLVHRMGDATQ